MADEMETPNNGTGWTQKEMLVRIDAKVDVIAAKQNHIDVEIALLKARADEIERQVAVKLNDSHEWRDEVRKEINTVKDEQNVIGRKLAYATGTVGAIVVVVNFIAPIILRNWGG
jgi:hypothetical protein